MWDNFHLHKSLISNPIFYFQRWLSRHPICGKEIWREQYVPVTTWGSTGWPLFVRGVGGGEDSLPRFELHLFLCHSCTCRRKRSSVLGRASGSEWKNIGSSHLTNSWAANLPEKIILVSPEDRVSLSDFVRVQWTVYIQVLRFI